MKKLFLLLCFFSFCLILGAQEVTVRVVRSAETESSSWQVLDESYSIVFSGNEFLKYDTVTFMLAEGKRYFFSVSINEDLTADVIYTLSLNGEPVIAVKPDIGRGDHFLPFFTGVQDKQTKITGGTNASISEFPWQVYVLAGNFRCGGSIIDNEWVVTAAHCTLDDSGNPIPADQFQVRAGSSVALDGERYFVQQVIKHENYNDATLINDIALLKLARPIDNPVAKPVDIITKEDVQYGATDPGIISWVTGWGLVQVDPRLFPSVLQKVQLPIITNAQASTVWSKIPATDLMAGFLAGNKDACNGDSGGPLVVQVIDEYKLAGIVSWGSSKCDTYGAYTRVSLFEDWIRLKTGIAKAYTPQAPAGDSIICESENSTTYQVNSVPGATSYEWKLLPESAGSVSGSSTTGTVTWNSSFLGHATLNLRVNIGGQLSDWSRIKLNVVGFTRFLSQSEDTAICEGQPITLNTSAEGHNLKYNWYRDGVLQQSGPSSQYRILSAKESDQGGYKVVITGSCGTVFSDITQLSVRALTGITSISPDTRAAFGTDVALEVNAEGYNLAYEWQKEEDVVENSDFPVLSLSNVNASDIGNYLVTISGTCGTVTSGNIYLFVEGDTRAGGPEVFIWPTLVSEEFHVAVNSDDLYDLYVYTSSGKLMMISSKNRYNMTFSIAKWAKGVYFVTVVTPYFRKNLKIVKN